METLSQIKALLEAAIPGAALEILPSTSSANQASLLVGRDHALAVATFLRDDPRLRLDYAANVTGVDWLDSMTKEKVTVKKVVDGVEKEIQHVVEKRHPGYLEAVYHLYSMELKQGPVVLRQRTGNRTDLVRLTSLTPIWRGAEFQEREIYDLYGIIFDGHPDLRRLLMWEGFEDYPMRKDYKEPDDYEYEPTPHDKLLDKIRQRAHVEEMS